MIHTQYFPCGEKLLAFNAKSGSSALVREVVRAYYPAIEKTIIEASYPAGKNADNTQHHHLLPWRFNPDRPVVQVVRCPVERFRSAMAQVGIDDADATLDELQSERGEYGRINGLRLAMNYHFLPQSRFSGTIEFFPVHRLDEAAEALGLRVPLPRINESGSKPLLTDEQADRVREWYAEDLELWERVR